MRHSTRPSILALLALFVGTGAAFCDNRNDFNCQHRSRLSRIVAGIIVGQYSLLHLTIHPSDSY